MKNISISTIFKYVFLTFVILWSGGGFTYGLFPYWMLYAFPIVGVAFYFKKYRFTPSDWKMLALLAFVLVMQYFKFNGALVSIVSPLFIITICMMASHLLRNSFPKIFVNIIYFFALASLILWCINLIPAGHDAIDGIAQMLPQYGWDTLNESQTNSVRNIRSIYLFTLSDEENFILRNMGPFWEPGRFTIFLTIAMAINLFWNNDKFYSFKNIVLLLTNITTFSTTGYSALAVLLLVYSLGSKRLSYVQKTLLVALLAFAAVDVWQLDFMADKIVEQSSQVDIAYSRFGAIFYHWTQIVESPYIGYGPYLSTAFMDLAISPNGITDLIRYFGIPLSVLFYFLLYRGTSAYISKRSMLIRLGVFASILVLCFSQTITYSPLFYILYFFGINKSKYETVK